MSKSTVREMLLSKLVGKRKTCVWGIDLGTTNSTLSVATLDIAQEASEGCLRVLEIDQETMEGIFTSPLVPSVVIRGEDGVRVGEGAKRLKMDPDVRLVKDKNLFYEAKNDIGTSKTYFQADTSIDAPWKVSGHVLKFIRNQAAAMNEAGGIPQRTVVTVPASFQLAQRQDTIRAAEMAGITLKSYDLLDEPIAALIDFILSEDSATYIQPGDQLKVLVFDFGGGTCDVIVADLVIDEGQEDIRISMLASSRYHRIGGGDIDSAIVHKILLPQLYLENGINPTAFKWEEKKRVLEPQLLKTAESLKIAISSEVARLKGFGKFEANKDAISVKQPACRCRINKREFTIKEPRLNIQQFDEILSTFIDQERLYVRDSEFFVTQSTFAPLEDALDRAGLDSSEIDFVLNVGGSSLLPQVDEAIRNYFSTSDVFSYKDRMRAQTAISRGAAWHALYMEAVGKPIIMPIACDGMGLLLDDDKVIELCPKGAALPYPSDGKPKRITGLVVPEASSNGLHIVLKATSDNRTLMSTKWLFDDVVLKDDPLVLECLLTENQEMKLRMFLKDKPDVVFEAETVNPFTNVVNPNQIKQEIEQHEEEMKQSGPTIEGFEELGHLYAKINHFEHAASCVQKALQINNEPDANLLNTLGIYYRKMGDTEKAFTFYAESSKTDPTCSMALFNAALMKHYDEKKCEEALDLVNRALEKTPKDILARGLKADILDTLGKTEEATSIFIGMVENITPLKKWHNLALVWLALAARHLDKQDLLAKIEAEQKKRNKLVVDDAAEEGFLKPSFKSLEQQK